MIQISLSKKRSIQVVLKKTTAEQDNRLVEAVRREPFKPLRTTSRALDIPYRIARRRLKIAGIRLYRAQKTQVLTPTHRRDRIVFCNTMLNLSRDTTDRIIYSNEKTFKSDPHGIVKVYRERGQRFNENYMAPNQRSGRVTSGFWIGRAGVGQLTAYNSNLDSSQYLDILEQVAEPSITAQYGDLNEVIFMQDNARVHTANIVKNYFENSNYMCLLDWPPYSPDLNPIENVWSELVRDWPLMERRNVPALRSIVYERWELMRHRQGNTLILIKNFII